ncbi:CCA tRNA nucleotidyltransferase [Lachnospiraceae bacterium oral taxon 500]|nr:CCA tRNA nucleotidyltransferase [Lachnospiraceae bacterium oral taxon 500]
MNRIEIPPVVAEVLEILQASGEQAYIVGGCVRDSIMGQVPKDWDITTSARPLRVKQLFPRTVDTGIKHGTVTVLHRREAVEVTTFRVDGQYEDHRHPKAVSFSESLKEDVARRDFTVNAMAYSPQRGVIDYFGGQDDLKKGLIRCVGRAEERFEEDALRMLRAVRFAAALNFKIEAATAEAIRQKKELLRAVSQERIRVEFVKTLASNHPEYLSYFVRYGLAAYFIPEPELPAEENAVFYNRLKALMPEGMARLAYLFCGGEKKLPAQDVKRILRRLTFDNRTTDIVTAVAANRDLEIYLEDYFFRCQLSRLGEEVFTILLQLAAVEGRFSPAETEAYLARAQRQPVRIADLAVDGRDIMALGIGEGRQVGECLDRLLQIVLRDPAANTRERLLMLAAEKRMES